MNFVYPYTIKYVVGAPPADPPLFTDDPNGGGTGNILFENVHVTAPYIFWRQTLPASGLSPTYGNIRFNNTDVYATYEVFEWNNIQEQVAINNFLSNPSLCGGGNGNFCNQGLKNWTSANGRWLHIVGANVASGRPAVGMTANNLTVVGYSIGILIDSNGQMDEAAFGSTSVWDAVPTILDVEPSGSVTHSSFSGKSQGARSDIVTPLFKFSNPQRASAGNNNDDNSISLNGFNIEGAAREFVFLDASGASANFGSITISAATLRDYCSFNSSSGIYIAGKVQNVAIVGSTVSTRKSGCGTPLNISQDVSVNPHSMIASNLLVQP